MSLTQSALLGFNAVKTVSYKDLVETSSGTAEDVALFNIASDSYVQEVGYYLNENFDGGATSTLVLTVGDDDDADGFITASVIHEDGTEISSKVGGGAYYTVGTDVNTGNGKAYDNSASKTITANFNPTGGANTALTQGEVTFFAKIVDLSSIK